MQQQRFAAYLDSLARAAGHLDRVAPLKSYCTGLLLPGERKSVEPLAARFGSAGCAARAPIAPSFHSERTVER